MIHHNRSLLSALFCVGLFVVACKPIATEVQDTPTVSSPTEVSATPTDVVLEKTATPILVTPTPDSMRFLLPTPGTEPLSSWRPPLVPIPWAPTILDHFYFARPIAADKVNWPLADYRYGGILPGSNATHTGIDIPADSNTPVLASGAGDVVWAGWGLFSGDPKNREDPYGLAVMIRHDFGFNDKQLFTVYAHMQKVDVVLGQWLETGDVLGLVGETGHASGPHLHFEVRLGGEDNFSTRNPELWLAPPQGWGLLVAQVTGVFKNPLDSVPVTVKSLSTDQIWEVHTYRSKQVNEDEYYQENIVLSDLPAGRYLISVPYRGVARELEIEIFPGRVSFFAFRGYLLFDTALPEVLEPDFLQGEAP